MDLHKLIVQLQQSFKPKVHRRPLDDWEGRRVCYEANIVSQSRIRTLLTNVLVWVPGESGDVRVIDHLWLQQDTQGLRNRVQGMAKIYRYIRQNGTQDFGLEPIESVLVSAFINKLKNSKPGQYKKQLNILQGVIEAHQKKTLFITFDFENFNLGLQEIKKKAIPFLESQINVNANYKWAAFAQSIEKNKPTNKSWQELNKQY